MSTDTDIPEHVLRHFAQVLWTIEEPLQLAVLPRDAWVLLGVIQFASRNPALSPNHKEIVERCGRAIQGALNYFSPDPLIAEVMEQGWNPEMDR